MFSTKHHIVNGHLLSYYSKQNTQVALIHVSVLFLGDGWIYGVAANEWQQLTYLPKNRPRYSQCLLKLREVWLGCWVMFLIRAEALPAQRSTSTGGLPSLSAELQRFHFWHFRGHCLLGAAVGSAGVRSWRDQAGQPSQVSASMLTVHATQQFLFF